jgi:hypothetical protein
MSTDPENYLTNIPAILGERGWDVFESGEAPITHILSQEPVKALTIGDAYLVYPRLKAEQRLAKYQDIFNRRILPRFEYDGKKYIASFFRTTETGVVFQPEDFALSYEDAAKALESVEEIDRSFS